MPDIQPTSQQPMSDDQELAKVLAGISTQTETPAIEEPVVTTPTPVQTTAEPEEAAATNTLEETPIMSGPEMPVDPMTTSTVMGSTGNDLEGIKKDAIVELRPLVDKLDLPAEEKFDTYLLLLRTTDDKELVAPAHEAAKNIPDEARRAQALLDIIKEIDFLSGQQAA